MNRNNEKRLLPKRTLSHRIEAKSYKIFIENIPENWIIRQMSERDYGVDCLIELVNDDDVTGELVSIQLKGTQKIKWTNIEQFKLSKINISTSNYWYNSPLPIFICLVDIDLKEVYYCSVKSFIRENFIEYNKQKKFIYIIDKKNKIDNNASKEFHSAIYAEKSIDELYYQITTFISLYSDYKTFLDNNTMLDSFSPVESDSELYLNHVYYNMKFLTIYFDEAWDLLSIKEYKDLGNVNILYNEQMTKICLNLESRLKLLLKIIVEFVNKNSGFWIMTDLVLFNKIINVNDNGDFFDDYISPSPRI